MSKIYDDLDSATDLACFIASTGKFEETCSIAAILLIDARWDLEEGSIHEKQALNILQRQSQILQELASSL